MSYVLDALRRAEAERQRGNVPGLHAQTLPAPEASPDGPGRPPGRWVPWLGGAVGVAAIAVAGVWWAGGWDGEGRTQAPEPVAPPLAEMQPPPVVVVPQPVRPPPVARAPVVQPARASAGTESGAETGAQAGGNAEAPQKPVPFEQLPEALRRQIPPLAFGGATHSPEPSARMLIINGQIWREGEEPAPGLRLERIELRTAQFRYRDRRFEIAY
jgi:general secretion pathway protein B